jgi:hypothetical protein
MSAGGNLQSKTVSLIFFGNFFFFVCREGFAVEVVLGGGSTTAEDLGIFNASCMDPPTGDGTKGMVGFGMNEEAVVPCTSPVVVAGVS